MTHSDPPIASPSATPEEPPAVAAPAAPPRRRTGLVVGIVVVVALLAAGVTTAVVLKSTSDSKAAPAAAATTPATAAPTPTQPPPYAGALPDLVVPKPAGATLTPDQRVGDPDGSLTAQQIASEYGTADQPTILSALSTAEFQRGVFLAWTDKGVLVYIEIYQFRYDREAAGWSTSMQRSIQNDATSTAVFDEIEGGSWYVSTTPNGRGAAHAYFSKGPFAVMINTFKTGTADLDGTKKLAVDQYRRLP